MEYSYYDLKQTIPEDILTYITRSQHEAWTFLPTAWKYPDLGLPPTLPQSLGAKNVKFSEKTNYEVLKICLEAAMKEELYSEAMAIIFTVDRYAYWLHHDETKYLLDIVQKIVDLHPEISVPPKLISRKIRLLKDTGRYQQADKVATSVLAQAASCLRTRELRLGSFVFEPIPGYQDEVRGFRLGTMATPFLLKGLIKFSLGSHLEAAVNLVAGGQIFHDVEPREPMGLAHCLQYLTEIILDMSSKDRDQLLNLIEFKYSNATTPFQFAEKCAKSATELLKEEYLYLKHMRTLVSCLLFQAIRAADKESFHDKLVRRVRDSFPTDTSKLDFESQERVLDTSRLIFLTYNFLQFYNLESHQVLALAKDMYRKTGLKTGHFDDDNLKERMGETREYIVSLIDGAPSNLAPDEEKQKVIDYPVLKSMSPFDLVTAYDDMNSENEKICPLAKIDVEIPTSFVDPLVTTVLKTSSIEHEPEILKVSHCSGQGSSTGATVDGMSSYQSLLSEPMMEISGFDGPRHLLLASEKREEEEVSDAVRILTSNLTADTVYLANLASYYTLDDQWRYSKTLVYVHDQLELEGTKKGGLRDVIKLQYLYQDDAKGMYVGKRYRRPRAPTVYRNDVIMHQLSRHYVNLFNQRLQYSKFANKIHMVPVILMEILAENGRDIIEVLNVEPYISGNFTKITNNDDLVNEKSVDSQLLLAFTHFTWCASDGQLMVTDLQGWVSDDPHTPCILTDPAINSDHLTYLGITNLGSQGMRGFWEKQHPLCNDICRLLGLERG